MSTAEALVRRAAERAHMEQWRTFIRVCASLAVTRGDPRAAGNYAASQQRWADADIIARYFEYRQKAAVPASTTSDTGINIPGTAAFIELVRPRTIVGQLSRLRRVPFNRNVSLATGGSIFAWVAQGAAAPVGRLTWTPTSLPETKVGGIAVFSDELVKLADAASETTMRDELVEGLVAFLDIAFVDPTFAAVADEAPGSITNGITGTASSGDPVTDLKVLLGSFTNLDNVAVIMSGASAVAVLSEAPGIVVDGLLFGFAPFIISNAAGTNLIAVRMTDILYADDGGIEVKSSNVATLQMDNAPTNKSTGTPVATNMVSLFQSNAVALRLLRFIGWLRRDANAVAVITGADYTP